MNRKLITFTLITFLFMLGCKEEQELEYKFWEPLSEQIQKAQVVAEQYAETELKVPKNIITRVKYSVVGFYKDGKRIIYMQFYDPEEYPDWENETGILGGFPHYYTVSVDSRKMKVVDSYAADE